MSNKQSDFEKLRFALKNLLDSPAVHSSYCLWPDGPCGGFSDMCSHMQKHEEAEAHARKVLKEIEGK